MSTQATDPSDVMRGVAGAVLLGAPLLYTQEVWDLGASLSGWVVLGAMVVALGINIGLSTAVGFRSGRIQRPIEDAAVGFGLSLILAALLLFLLERTNNLPWEHAIGIVVLSSIPISIGFAIGNALAPHEGGAGAKKMQGEQADLLVAAAGAIVFALNIAPTEEPILLAAELGWVRLGLVLLTSLVLPYLIVFYAEFEGRDQRVAADGATQGPLVETMLAYLIAFALSAAMLLAFGRLDGMNGASLAAVVTLAFPASLGAALGRVLI